MNFLPIKNAFLCKQIGSSQVLRVLISDQAVQSESVRVFWLFDVVVEVTSNNSVLYPTELLGLPLNNMVIEAQLLQKGCDLQRCRVPFSEDSDSFVFFEFLDLEKNFYVKFVIISFKLRHISLRRE